MQRLPEHSLVRRELRAHWRPNYPHLQPQLSDGLPARWAEFSPPLQRWLQRDGYILGTTLLALEELPDWYLEVAQVDGYNADAECCLCGREAHVLCHDCAVMLCSACCVEAVSVPNSCCAALYCNLKPEFHCGAGHPLCEEHLEACAVCEGRFAAMHTPHHRTEMLVLSCHCGAAGTRMCLCGASYCDECSLCCGKEQPARALWQNFGCWGDWRPFAHSEIAWRSLGDRALRPDGLREHLYLYCQIMSSVQESVALDLQENVEYSDTAESSDDGGSTGYSPQASESDSSIDLGPPPSDSPPLVSSDSDSSDTAQSAQTLVLQTTYEGSQPIASHIDAEQATARVEALLQSHGTDALILLTNTNPESAKFGHIAMAVHWWRDDSCSLHHVCGTVQELLELLDASQAHDWLPSYFFASKHPPLADPQKKSTT
jgi:hypothetical protein